MCTKLIDDIPDIAVYNVRLFIVHARPRISLYDENCFEFVY